MRVLVVLAYVWLFLGVIIFSGCTPATKIVTQEVYIPVKCNLELPTKPKEDGSFESHKELAKYYLKLERVAKDCVE
ncbi:hypothetical protein [Helicobacter sp. WB40]|uniref:hypothetical protein n=1 Tax=Helicobacter sp. WB40 TaxID=3004130 RepID=UPI0022EBEC16|nr:hypothetical protein [Helicobacter sp. WB40]MDA3967364.1 hypothetical protein [Helicobacter sp. WB40]